MVMMSDQVYDMTVDARKYTSNYIFDAKAMYDAKQIKSFGKFKSGKFSGGFLNSSSRDDINISRKLFPENSWLKFSPEKKSTPNMGPNFSVRLGGGGGSMTGWPQPMRLYMALQLTSRMSNLHEF
jgi:hypothetical protein